MIDQTKAEMTLLDRSRNPATGNLSTFVAQFRLMAISFLANRRNTASKQDTGERVANDGWRAVVSCEALHFSPWLDE